MKIHVQGLGQFGMFLSHHLVEQGHEVRGNDINISRKVELESFGGVWGKYAQADVLICAVFPRQMEEIPRDGSLVVNLSSVQTPGVVRLQELGLQGERLMSFHPLFGPVGISKSGWIGKQIIVTKLPIDSRADDLLKSFVTKGAVVDIMSVDEHDNKMAPHALAFLLSELISAGLPNVDARYLTGSAHHMIGLLEFTSGSPELRHLILSNPAIRQSYRAISKRLLRLQREFCW